MEDNTPVSRDTPGVVPRAKAIILAPKTEWPRIADEATSTRDVFLRYAVPLAAIGPIAALIGGQLFGYSAFLVTYRPSLAAGLSTAITSYILSLAGLFVIAFVANWLAPKFDGKENFERAFKLCAYAFTASWLAGIFQLIPSLSVLGLLGLYSLYLFYLGAGPMMAVPQAKSAGYTAVTVIAAIIVYLVVGAIAGAVTGAFGPSATIGSAEIGDARIAIAGGG